MNCTEYLSQLHDYFLGRLTAEHAARLDAHAAGCRECGALLARAKELSCREFTDFLNAYVEDELPPERQHVFERHLEICADCRNYLQSYRQTMKLSVLALTGESSLLPQALPEELILAVLKAIPPKKDG